MQAQLSMLLEKVKKLQDKLNAAPSRSPQQRSPMAAALAGEAAGLLINEVLDWRVVFLDQPLKPPA